MGSVTDVISRYTSHVTNLLSGDIHILCSCIGGEIVYPIVVRLKIQYFVYFYCHKEMMGLCNKIFLCFVSNTIIMETIKQAI